ncbi:hypothetical protein [Pseudorhodobacter sp. MZDSW-24AT]|uniref:hypothetical protein n=1 Tax=Pseudorhodobacter sp. MZDSW-24AT TaxID=2052957 RepID=UPI0012FDFC9B|nr:hypothetical protein [Pseudorhodobacter sp. MZDSW-24AT]
MAAICHAAVDDPARTALRQLGVGCGGPCARAIGGTGSGRAAVTNGRACDRAEKDAGHHFLRHLFFLALLVGCLGAQPNIPAGGKVTLKFRGGRLCGINNRAIFRQWLLNTASERRDEYECEKAFQKDLLISRRSPLFNGCVIQKEKSGQKVTDL